MSTVRLSNPRMLVPLLVGGTALVALVATLPMLRSKGEPSRASSRIVEDPSALSGRVVWSDGRPALSARVWMRALHDDFGPLETSADLEGVFRYPEAPAGSYALTARILDTRGPVLRTTAIGHVEFEQPAASPVVVSLVRLLPIRGTVVDTANRRLAEVGVTAASSDPLFPFVPRLLGVTESDGRFEVWAPEGALVDLEGVRRSRFADMVMEVGPKGRLSGVRSGAENVVLAMPDPP